MTATRGARFYFSFRSPYSWIAARLVAERLGPQAGRLRHIPYWEGDGVTRELLRQRGAEILYAPMTRQKHLYILQDVKRLTRHLGYAHVWPLDQDPWWERPHLAYLAARRRGKGAEFLEAAYRARWEEGRDICAADTLRALAEEVGLEPDALAAAPDDPDLRREGVDGLLEAYREGVFGIPFFASGFEKFWGVDRLAAFLARVGGDEGTDADGPGQLLGHGLDIPPEAARRVGAYDHDCAGGCG